MLKVKKKGDQYHISITRGDSGYLEITPTDKKGDPLDLIPGVDEVHVQVRSKPSDKLLFDGDVSRDKDEDDNDIFLWHIHPYDTRDAEIGTYYWDAQIEHNGEEQDVSTFIEISEFNITDEVTRRNDQEP